MTPDKPRHVSLRRKLMRTIWASSAAAIGLSALTLFTWEQVTYQPRLAEELTAKADLLSLNLHAALNFNDVPAAVESLAVLHAVPEISLACVFRPDGSEFARYRLPGSAFSCQPRARSLEFVDGALWLTRPVHYQQETVGQLQLRYQLPSLLARMGQYAAALLLMSAMLALLASTLSRLLRRQITDPVLELAQLAAEVTEGGTCQARATPRSSDEIGRLALAFNRMLDTVQQRERELYDSKALLQAIIENTPAAIYVKDRQSRFLLVNRFCARLFGKTPAEIAGKSAVEFYSPAHAAQHEANDRQMFESGQVLEAEEDVPQADGVHTYLSVKFPLHDQNGQAYALCGISTDITERKQAQRQLEDYRDQLEAAVAKRTAELEIANKELQAFSYSVSHDLRAPLRAIDGFSSMLVEDYSEHLDATGQDYLQRVRKAAARMGELIDDMLNLSRVSSVGMQSGTTNLSVIATGIMLELQTLDPQRDCQIDIQPNLLAEADPQLIQIALRNLLENAWKYSARKPKACICFGATLLGDGRYEYFVRDNGAGFDMTYANKLFKPFQRLHPNEDFEGTGVGLATVSRVIQRHGGQIRAEAVPGEGATFFFTLAACPT